MFLDNPWITGIGGGVVSGFIVYFITNLIYSRRENKEYWQKITTANNELLYAMRPLIVQKQIPSKAIVNSMIESTARKYGVNKDDLFDIHLLTDDLIREVMENSFLSSGQKMDFCSKINELEIENQPSNKIELTSEKIVFQNNRLSSRYVSLLLASTVAMMVLFLYLFMVLDMSRSSTGISAISTIALTGILTSTLAALTTTFLKRIKQMETDKRERKEDEDKKL